jgi:hypothetical protein
VIEAVFADIHVTTRHINHQSSLWFNASIMGLKSSAKSRNALPFFTIVAVGVTAAAVVAELTAVVAVGRLPSKESGFWYLELLINIILNALKDHLSSK